MPKIVFRFRTSNIGLQQKLLTDSSKKKPTCKTSSKFVWIDGSLKKDWISLKNKSGCRTNRLFLYYLLRLAKKHLFRFGNDNKETKDDRRKSKRGNLPKNETKDDENKSKKEKLSVGYDTSKKPPWRKSLGERLEKENKIKVQKKDLEDEEEKASDFKVDVNTKRGVIKRMEENDEMSSCEKVLSQIKNYTESGYKNEEVLRSRSNDREVNEKRMEKKTEKGGELARCKNKLKETKCKEKVCVVCNSKHSGKCLSEDSTRHCGVIKYNLNISSSKESLDNGIYSFEEPEKQECVNGRNKKLVGDVQKRKIPEMNTNFCSKGRKNTSDNCNTDSKSFAKTTLPEYFLLKTKNTDHGLSVFTKVLIKKSTQFGPLMGQNVKEMDIGDEVNMKDIWQVQLADGISYINTQDEETSNWLRFLRPADSRGCANLVTIVKNDNLYFGAVKDIQVGEELVYWTSDSYPLWSKKKLEKKNCGGCNIQFTHTLHYLKHCLIFHDPTVSLTTRKYYCKICGLAVIGKAKIIQHAVEMHHGKGAYQCQFCHKFFLRLSYLEMHRTYGCSENPQRSRPLCDLCGRKFCQPQKLKAHIRRMHSEMAVVLRDFQCKNCQKILGSIAALQRHNKEVHNKGVIGAFTCDRCGKTFQNKSNLKIHMLTHSGVKPFKCQEKHCRAAFTTKQCLKLHYKKIHGFSDEVIPKIERSVAYTFDAYSGGAFPNRNEDTSIHLENSPYSVAPDKNEGVDLTLGLPAAQDSSNETHINLSPLLPEDSKLIVHIDDKYLYTKGSKESTKQEPESFYSAKTPTIIPEVDDICETKLKTRERKLWSISDLNHTAFKENPGTGLLVEAAFEKDIAEKSPQGSCKSIPCGGDDEVMESHAEIYSFSQYENNPPDILCESNLKRPLTYEKLAPENPKTNNFQEAAYKANFLFRDRSNFNEIFKFSNLGRSNTPPLSEIPKDCNLVISMRDQDGESLTEDDVENSRNKELEEISKEALNDGFRSQEVVREEKFGSSRISEYDLRLPSAVKFDYDVDFSNEYRNLEKNRSLDLGFPRLADERVVGVDREVGAENLCLKEKLYQCENLEEFAKFGREGSGLENVFSSDTIGQNQSFGTFYRSSHGIVSPRSYHPLPFESESVDLSIRPPFSSSPIYTLDLTPSRIDLPARHLDFRSHLGLPTLRFPSPTSAVANTDSPQMSSPGYGILPSSYGVSAHRPCQSSQFQPYTPLYY